MKLIYVTEERVEYFNRIDLIFYFTYKYRPINLLREFSYLFPIVIIQTTGFNLNLIIGNKNELFCKMFCFYCFYFKISNNCSFHSIEKLLSTISLSDFTTKLTEE